MGLAERFRSDIAYFLGARRIVRRVTPLIAARHRTMSDALEEWAQRWGDRPALLSESERFTYGELDARANRYARFAREQGLAKGDVVALVMPNRPEYMAVWLGIARAGGSTALLNTHLTRAALAHSIGIVKPKLVIVAGELLERFETAAAAITGVRVFVHGPSAMAYPRVDEAVAALSGEPLAAAERPALTIDDTCLYIYTSGTTGLPKAAKLTHYRVQGAMHAFSELVRAGADDRIYVALPIYHTAGGVVAPGIALTVGGSVVIGEKFSADRFWDDVVRWDCTMFQYIGELCRYLLHAPENPNETRHEVRLATGNGLRADIWSAFQNRFRIPKIVEWYAATEGNVQLFNMDGRPGAVGRIPKWFEKRTLTRIVRFDVQTQAPVRGPDGFCIVAPPGEAGEAIGRIVVDPARPGQRFDGYADPRENDRKILHDVFEPGDSWFRTGDLMRRNERGYFYFVDRIGDTFRWKGENVSTGEVEERLTAFPGVREASVYGVEVPGRDGRAGMAAIVADGALDLEALAAHLGRELPAYARPVFLRMSDALEKTETFKLRKLDLVAEGFDPTRVADPLYASLAGAAGFVRIDTGLHARILGGAVRL